jgi:hypothetical protein
MTYEQFLADYYNAYCSFRVRCGLMPEGDLHECVYKHARPTTRIAAIDAGIVIFEAAHARECIGAIEARTCDSTTPEFRRPICRELVTGTRGDGAFCMFDEECISNECWFDSGTTCDDNGCCFGTCVGDRAPNLSPRAGDVCRIAPCVDSFCADGLCMPLLPELAVCNDVDDWGYQRCDYGLECVGGRCVRTVGVGESCIDPALGQLGCRSLVHHCNPLRNVCETPRPIGATCAGDFDCSSWLYCDSTKHCAEKPPPAPIAQPKLGEPCRAYVQPCQAPAACEPTSPATLDGTCILRKPDGESCISYDACVSGICREGICTSHICI